MSAIGVGFLENDYALDFVLYWEDYAVPAIDSGAWDSKKTWLFFQNLYFKNRFNTLDTIQNAEILVLVVLFDKHRLELPTALKVAAENTINSEL